jgi:hypothetical protein
MTIKTHIFTTIKTAIVMTIKTIVISDDHSLNSRDYIVLIVMTIVLIVMTIVFIVFVRYIFHISVIYNTKSQLVFYFNTCIILYCSVLKYFSIDNTQL